DPDLIEHGVVGRNRQLGGELRRIARRLRRYVGADLGPVHAGRLPAEVRVIDLVTGAPRGQPGELDVHGGGQRRLLEVIRGRDGAPRGPEPVPAVRVANAALVRGA